MGVTHLFVSAKPAAVDPTQVGSVEWNAAHVVSISDADVAVGAAIAESKLSLNYATHAALTLGSPASGLSLAGQVLTLGLASSGVTGALSGADWNTFNGKQSALTFPLAANLGGTGIINTGTFTNNSNTVITGGGTIALGGYALTVPATGTAALLGTANVFTAAQSVSIDDTATNTPTTVLTIDHTTSNAAAVEFGSQILARLEADNGTLQNAGAIVFDWGSASFPSVKGRVRIGANESGTLGYPFSMTARGVIFNALTAQNGDAILDVTDGGTSVFRVRKNNAANGNVRVFQIYTGTTAFIVSGGANATADLQRWQDSSSVVLGSVNSAGVALHSPITTTANAVLEAMKLQATVSTASTGGAAGFGPGLSFYAETATDGTNQQQALIASSWVDATNASRKAKLSLSAYDTAQRVGLEIAADGSLPTVNVIGSTVGNEVGDATTDLRWETDTEANMLFVDASADKMYIGGTTNGMEFSKGGTLKALGTATWFDDIRVEPTVRGSGPKAPTYTNYTPSGTASGIYFYLFDNSIAASEKEVNFKMQMPHGKLLESAIHVHVHWTPTSTGSAGDKVRWGLEYTKANPNGVYGPTTTIYATDPISPPTTTPTVDTHYLTEFADISMTGDALSTILLCRLFRNSSDAADTFTGSVGLLYIDAHIEFSQLGSNDEYVQ